MTNLTKNNKITISLFIILSYILVYCSNFENTELLNNGTLFKYLSTFVGFSIPIYTYFISTIVNVKKDIESIFDKEVQEKINEKFNSTVQHLQDNIMCVFISLILLLFIVLIQYRFKVKSFGKVE